MDLHAPLGTVSTCVLIVIISPPTLQTVALWDLRNLKLKLHSFESHRDEVFQVSLTVLEQQWRKDFEGPQCLG